MPKTKAKAKDTTRPARICQHCGAAETLKTYKSIQAGLHRLRWARCSECNRVTRERTIIA